MCVLYSDAVERLNQAKLCPLRTAVRPRMTLSRRDAGKSITLCFYPLTRGIASFVVVISDAVYVFVYTYILHTYYVYASSHINTYTHARDCSGAAPYECECVFDVWHFVRGDGKEGREMTCLPLFSVMHISQNI